MRSEIPPDFAICPHCWHLNGPLSRICVRCRADMTLMLQESGGGRWTAAVQSPVPIGRGPTLNRIQRALLLGIVILFGVTQLVYAFAPTTPLPRVQISTPGSR